MAQWQGKPEIKGSTETMRMALLTFSIVGIALTWGVEMTYCTPYLLQLGLTKSRTSLVWIAGPLSGLITQPIIGIISDRSTSKYGRRRPFMIAGSILVALCLVALGWTKEIVGVFVAEGPFRKSCTIVVAVLSIYAVDFAINAVGSCSRSLIVDTLPASKQQMGSAWASRMGSIGNVIGYAIGTLDLVAVFGTTFGETQFKQLTLLAAFSLLAAVSVTSWAVAEKVLLPDDAKEEEGLGKIVREIYHTTMTLPPRIQAICNIQLWSWIGFFPFLFYSSTFVGETYFRFDAPHDVKQSKDALGDIGRIGSLALSIFSCVTFTGAFLLPLIIKSPDEEGFTPRPPVALAGVINKLNENKPDLVTAWIWGNSLFAIAMLLTPMAHSFRFATFLVALCGLPWAVASWAPGTYLGMEVQRLATAHSLPMTTLQRPKLSSSPSSATIEKAADAASVSGSGELSGLYFGILNIYTTIPQFIGTFISMIVFAVLEPGKSPELAHDAHPSEHHGTDGPNAIAVCMFIGGLCCIGAAVATKRLKKLMDEVA